MPPQSGARKRPGVSVPAIPMLRSGLDSIIPSRFTSLMVSFTGMPTTQALHLHTALYARSMISPVTKGGPRHG